MDAAQLAQDHWNETPLFLTEQERYSAYPWLFEVAEFKKHAGDKVLEIGCGTGADLLQFARHGAIATGIDLTSSHVELARRRLGSYFTLWRFLRYGSNWKRRIESSQAPVHIDLYTERRLRKLFGATASIEKHQCKPFEFLAPLFGWYLVVKDQKPQASID
jgi:SAM-dependent methyltransferase